MKKIVVASLNPVKINAVQQGFAQMFPELEFVVDGVRVNSGVAAQPMGDQETLTGAKNRAENAVEQAPQADFWVGIEGGLTKEPDKTQVYAWVYIKTKDKVGQAKTGTFFLPAQVVNLVEQGLELGDAIDQAFAKNNHKQKGGAISILTDNVITRTQLYVQPVIFALIPFKKKQLNFAYSK